MQLLAAQYCPLPTHRRVKAIANRQPPRPSLGGVRQIDHVAMCGSERSLRSYTIFALLLLCGCCSLVRHVTARTRMRQFDFGAYGDVGVAKKRHI